MWAPAARAPPSELPTFSTATPISRSAQVASARARRAPSPSDSSIRAIEPTPSVVARASSQSLGSSTAELPVETTVWKPRPRSEPRALTPKLPLWVITATGPGVRRSTESPQSGARAATETTPLPFGPQTGMPGDARRRLQLVFQRPPRRGLAEPRGEDDRAAAAALAGFDQHRRAGRRRDRDDDRVDRLRQVGHGRDAGRPWTSSRFGLTP